MKNMMMKMIIIKGTMMLRKKRMTDILNFKPKISIILRLIKTTKNNTM